MAVDLNLDIGSLLKKLMGDGSLNNTNNQSISDKIRNYKYTIILCLIIIVLAGSFYNFVYIPLVDSNLEKQKVVEELLKKQSEIPKLKAQATKIKKNLSSSRKQYLEELAHFGNSEDLGELYQSISTIASKYNMLVLNIKEIQETVTNQPIPTDKDKKAKNDKQNQMKAKEVKVSVELKGRYNEYMLFKEDLAIAEILLTINSESVKVGSGKSEDKGIIFATLNLTTYAIDKKPFQEVIGHE